MTSFPFTDIAGRTVGLFGELDPDKCLATADALLRIRSTGSRENVHLYLGCFGGEPDDVFLLLDCLMLVKNRLRTYLTRISDLHGALLLTAGKRRHALPNSRLVISTPSDSHLIGFGRLPIGNHGRERASRFLIQQLGEFPANQLLTSHRDIDAKEALGLGIVHKIIEPRVRFSKEVITGKGRSR